jgi:hypothetical protein
MADGGSEPAWPAQVQQAIGMIVAQAGVGADEAARRLVDHAFAAGRTVHETAVDVLERRLRFDDT